VCSWRDLHRETVRPVRSLAHFPRDEAAKEGSACRAGALARDQGELGGGAGEHLERSEG
jgi:hypothetical protein